MPSWEQLRRGRGSGPALPRACRSHGAGAVGAPRLLRGTAEAMHGRLGPDGDGRCSERRRAALPGGVDDPGARVRERSRAFAGVDLDRLRRVRALPGDGLDAGAMPHVPARTTGAGLGRLSLSGAADRRRRGGHGSGLPVLARITIASSRHASRRRLTSSSIARRSDGCACDLLPSRLSDVQDLETAKLERVPLDCGLTPQDALRAFDDRAVAVCADGRLGRRWSDRRVAARSSSPIATPTRLRYWTRCLRLPTHATRRVRGRRRLVRMAGVPTRPSHRGSAGGSAATRTRPRVPPGLLRPRAAPRLLWAVVVRSAGRRRHGGPYRSPPGRGARAPCRSSVLGAGLRRADAVSPHSHRQDPSSGGGQRMPRAHRRRRDLSGQYLPADRHAPWRGSVTELYARALGSDLAHSTAAPFGRRGAGSPASLQSCSCAARATPS